MAAPRVHVAVARGDVGEVRRLVGALGSAVHEAQWESSFGVSPLHVASAHGQAGAARELVRVGAAEAVARRDTFGNTPLHDAAFHGAAEVAAVLLGAGADADAVNDDGRTPLHKAAAGKAGAGSERVARLLLRHGADANRACRAGRTPLHIASFKGRWALVSLLIAGGADPARRAPGNAGNAAAFAARGRARRKAVALARRTGWRRTPWRAALASTAAAAALLLALGGGTRLWASWRRRSRTARPRDSDDDVDDEHDDPPSVSLSPSPSPAAPFAPASAAPSWTLKCHR